jgi:type I restriction enzyme M protein
LSIKTRTSPPKYLVRLNFCYFCLAPVNRTVAPWAVSTAEAEAEIDLAATHRELVNIEKAIRKATNKHNEFLKELGLSLLPSSDSKLSTK